MKKRFKSKNKKTTKLVKVIIGLTLAFLAFYKTLNYFVNKKVVNSLDNTKVLNYLLASSTNNYIENDNFMELISNFNLNDPVYLVNNSFNNYLEMVEIDEKEDTEVNNLDERTYFSDPNKVEINKPLVYIYNTHQSEAYSAPLLNDYNVSPGVLMASYILKEKLNELGVHTIVEETNITELLRTNNWQYKYSYKASRLLLDDIKTKEPTIKYFIDLHRDSSKREKTITDINGETYARVLFVVGLEHEGYEANLKIANDLNERFKAKHENISRGIYQKSGPGVNGIYNQDISPNAILLEVGGQYNTIDEVNRTINFIAPIIAEYIKELENAN